MRVSYEWLSKYVKLPQDPAELVARLVDTGTEVESCERAGAALDKVVTGQIIEKSAHPDSDHLWVTKVDVGEKNLGKDGKPEPLQIVCGAQNFKQGDHIIVAMVGAVLPGDFVIKKSRLRGVDSCGMNCSARELAIGSEHDGIMILPEDAPIGMDAADYLGLADTILDCEITPNRPDCLSMEGMAREVAAILDTDYVSETPLPKKEQGEDAASLVDVTIEDPKRCPRYVARVVKNVKVGPSPEWLARRVQAAGTRSINNVVDVTNYVMYLTGHPLHAFDLGKLTKVDGKYSIVVRAARAGEKLTTLDDIERELNPDITLITDAGKTPIALAGVMGGENSEIDDTTVEVLLEAATFDNGHTSRTSRSLNLLSEASMRYERKVAAEGCRRAADIAAALFEECCSAEVCPGVVDVYPEQQEIEPIKLRCERVRALCGAKISDQEQIHILEKLGCSCTKLDGGIYEVSCPSNRPDLLREIDLVEEVLRLWGMSRVEATLPRPKNHIGGLTQEQKLKREIGRRLRTLGLSETVTYAFADPRDLARLNISQEGKGLPVRLINPLVSDQSEMRRSLIPGLLRSVAYNQAHGVSHVELYEIGRVFYGKEGASQPNEPSLIGAVLAGKPDATWNSKPEAYDFYSMKGIVEDLLEWLRIKKFRFVAADPARYGHLQPGRAAELQASGQTIGVIGCVHPQYLEDFELSGEVVVAELSLSSLLKLASAERSYEPIPTLPGIQIDLALVVDESVSYETLMQRVRSAGGKLLSDVVLFDVYRNAERLGEGKKSMALSLTYRSEQKTLTSEEVEKTHAKLIAKLASSLGAEVRG